MKKSKLPIIQIKRKEHTGTSKISTGANTIVLLDGKPLKGCSRITIDIKARKVAKVKLEMLATIKADVAVSLKKSKVKPTRFKLNKKKYLAVYTLSNFAPSHLIERTGKK